MLSVVYGPLLKTDLPLTPLLPPVAATATESSTAPTAVDLIAESDTGISDSDDLTNLNNSTSENTLQFEVSGTVSGATVTLYADGVAIGSAIADATTTIVTTDGTTVLTNGTREITATQTKPAGIESGVSAVLSVTIDTTVSWQNNYIASKILADDGAVGDFFGYSVSISGTTAIVGADRDDDNGTDSGSAYIFEFTDDGWEQVTELTADDDYASYDRFGSSVSISGTTAIVGAYLDEENGSYSGSAYIFELTANGWEQVAKLTANDGAASDCFGKSVSISGSIAIVGSYFDDDNGASSGSAYIFQQTVNGWEQVTKLTSDDGAAGDFFGYSVSISGTTVIVGSHGDDDNDISSGSAYIFELTANGWEQTAKLTAADGASSDYFGESVSVSGTIAIVGAAGDDDSVSNSGSAYIFQQTADGWEQVAKLTADDGAANDYFGRGVSISDSIAIVGAYNINSSNTSPGSAYLFQLNDDGWEQITKLTADDGTASDRFGPSVSISSKIAIVGASRDDDNGDNSGSLYTFFPTSTFALQAASDTGLSDSDNITNDNTPTFDINSTSTLPYYRLYRDGIQISDHYETASTYTSPLLADGTYDFKLVAVDEAGNESVPYTLSVTIDTVAPSSITLDLQAGSDLGLHDDDNLTCDDTPTFDVSATSYFRVYRDGVQVSNDYETGTSYTALSQADGTYDYALTAVDIAGNESVLGDSLNVTIETVAPAAITVAPDLQATSDTGVSDSDNITNDDTPTFNITATGYYRLYRDGVLVGDYETDSTYTSLSLPDGTYEYTVVAVDKAGNESAASPVLTVTIDTTVLWQNNYIASKILADDGAGGDCFGYSVSISGTTAIVGAYGDDDNGTDSGSAYIFEFTDDGWEQVAELTADDDYASYDFFGSSVSISGTTAIVGAYLDEENGSYSGSAYIFELTANGWEQVAKLTANDGAASDYFGYSVAISGTTAIVGSYFDDDNGDSSGSAYIFKQSGATWVQVAKLTADDGAAYDYFGYSVSISGTTAIVGASRDNDNGNSSGSAYIFELTNDGWKQVVKLTADDGAEGDRFGYSVSINATTAIVGAYLDDNSSGSGSAYIFELTDDGWEQVTKLIANGGTVGDYFGYSVSISGTTAIVGACADDGSGDYSGSAYVFRLTADGWEQVTKLTAADGAAYDYFGYSVSISGTTVIAGARWDDDNGTVSGSTYIFNQTSTIELQAASDTGYSETDNITNDSTPTFDITTTLPYCRIYRDGILVSDDYETASTYTSPFLSDGTYDFTVVVADEAGNETFPYTLSITIDTVAPSSIMPDLQTGSDLGLYNDDNLTCDNTPTFDVPATSYFRVYRDGVQISDDYETGTGYTAAVQADGTYDYALIAVDAAGNESALGDPLSVTIETVAPAAVTVAPDLQAASDTGLSDSDNLTNDVTPTFDVTGTGYYRLYRDDELACNYETADTCTALSQPHGTFEYTVVVVDEAGNESAPSPALTVTIDTTASWQSEYIASKVLADDGATGDYFGYSVSISGTTAIVGAYQDDDNGTGSGSAYIFELTDTGWEQVTKLTADDGAELDYFGYSVSISGTTAAVGAYQDDDKGISSGSAYIFELTDTGWEQVTKLTSDDGAADHYFGYDVSICGTTAIVGTKGDDDNGILSGSAYIFQLTDGSWEQVAKLTADDGAERDCFGYSVSISGTTTVVGAPYDDDRGSSSGSVYIFELTDTGWEQVTKLTPDDGAVSDNFGGSVSISGTTAMVGSGGDDDNGSSSGSAYIFQLTDGNWEQVAKLTADDGAELDYFGHSVSISGTTAVVGAYQDDDDGGASGSAYIFELTAGGWEQAAKLTADDGTAGDYFGCSVSVSGTTTIVGTPYGDDNGNGSGSAYTFLFVPTIDLQVANDTGPSDSDNITSCTTPTFDITATPYYRLYRNGVQISGDYETASTYTSPSLADGTYDYTIIAIDDAGNESLPYTLSVTIDTIVPQISDVTLDLQSASDLGISDTDNLTCDNTPTFEVTGSAYFRIFLDETEIGGYESGSFTLLEQPDGTYSLTIIAVDAAGNESTTQSEALIVTIETVAPETPDAAPALQTASDTGISSTDNLTNDVTPTFDVSVTAYYRFYCDGVQISSDNEMASSYVVPTQTDGSHEYAITAVDAAGNESAPSPALAVTIDTIAPSGTPAIDLQAASDTGASDTDNVTNAPSPTFDITATPYYRLYRDGVQLGGDYEVASSYTSEALSNGTYNYTIVAVDEAGNETSSGTALSVTIDTVAPDISGVLPDLTATSDMGISDTDNLTCDNTPTFEVIGSPYFRLYCDGALISGDESGSYTAPTQPDGTHSFTIVAIDEAGNESALSDPLSVTIETIAPDAPPIALDLLAVSDSGLSDADNITNDTTPTFAVTSPGYYRLYRDNVRIGDYQTTSSYTTSPQPDGMFRYRITAVDEAGNESLPGPAVNVRIDTQAPLQDFQFIAELLAEDSMENSNFGYSVAVSGTTAIVGTREGNGDGTFSGAAYIFEQVGSIWLQVSKLTADDGTISDGFGSSVAISGTTAIVGAFGDDDNGYYSGSAYIFEQTETGWEQVEKLTADDAEPGEYFGTSVSISGNVAIVGARGDDESGYYSGSAYIFEQAEAGWEQVAKIMTDDGASGDYFGSSVSIDGTMAIVGAYQDDDNGYSSGSAYLFEQTGDTWNQVAKLTATDGVSMDYFGYSVAINDTTAIVGAYYDDDSGSASGSAYIFKQTENAWEQVAKLTANDGASGDLFGSSVAISGNVAIVGAYRDDESGTDFGSAYIFEDTGNAWNQVEKLTNDSGAAGDYFGTSVSISGTNALVGAYGTDGNGNDSGLVHIFSSFPTIDLQSASDTGISDNDNFTSDTTPTFDIAAMPYYRLYRDGVQIGNDYETASSYTSEILPDGTYEYTVVAIDEAGNQTLSDIPLALTITPSADFTPGDANSDGRVDGSDVTILAGNWQIGVGDGQTATWNMGDFNADGKVDGSDVTILAANWQSGVSAATAVSSASDAQQDYGPRIISHSPNVVSKPIDSLMVTFDKSIDSQTFTTDCVRVLRMQPNVCSYASADGTEGVTIVDSLAYVADYRAGLQILDISDPLSPTFVGSYDTSGFARSVAVSDSMAYVADTSSGLQIIDVSNPSQPTLVGSYNPSGFVYAVAASGTLVYVTHTAMYSTSTSLEILDVSDPSTPKLLGHTSSGGIAFDIEISGTLAYVTDQRGGLRIIDVTDPSMPALVGSYTTDGYAHDTTVVGTLAYVAYGASGLKIIDISNPTSPMLVGSYDMDSLASGVAVSGNIAYVANDLAGLQVLDISDPTEPTLIESYNTDGEAYRVTVSDSIAYVADRSSLQILDLFVGTEEITQLDSTTFQIDLSETVAEGEYEFSIIPDVTDLSGNAMDQNANGIGGERPEDVYSFLLTIDFTSPSAPSNLVFTEDTGLYSNDAITNDASLTWTWSESSDDSMIAGYEYRLNTDDWVFTEELSVEITCPEGEQLFEVRAMDVPGNVSTSVSAIITVDLTPPEVPTNLYLANCTFYWSEATDVNGIWKYEYRVDGGNWEETELLEVPTDLENGQCALLEVRAIDLAGNIGAVASATLTADFGPQVINCGPSTIVNTIGPLTVTFNEPIDPTTFTVEDAVIFNVNFGGSYTEVAGVIQIDDTTYQIDLPDILLDGSYQILIGPEVEDMAGNAMDQNANGISGESVSDVYSFQFTVDTTPPSLPGDLAFTDDTGSLPDDAITNDASVTLTWSESSDISGIAGYEYRVDGGDWIWTDQLSAEVTVSEGQRVLEVRAVDNPGNASEASGVTLTLDLTPPIAPTGLDLAGAILHWDEATDLNGIWKYEYRVDSGDWVETTITEVLTDLTDGQNVFLEVRATDQAGNTSPVASATLTADYGPHIVSSNPSDGDATTPIDSFTVTFNEPIDPATFTPEDVVISREHASADPEVEAISITQLDTVTYQVNLSYTLTENEYDILIGPGITDLTGNVMDQNINGISGEGSADTYAFHFAVDTTPPTTPSGFVFANDSGMLPDDAITNDSLLTLTWTKASDTWGVAGYEYRTDSGDRTFTTELTADVPVADGEHHFEVRAVDTTGNSGEAVSLNVTVDLTPPTVPTELRLDGAKLFWTESTDANGIWKYEYRVDGGDWAETTLQEVLTDVPDEQTAVFEVRAIDQAGNVGPIVSTTLTTDFGPRIVNTNIGNATSPIDSLTITFDEPIDPTTFTVEDAEIIQTEPIIGSYNTDGYAFDVSTVGTTAYVADGYRGLQIIDVSNPFDPILLDNIDTPDSACGITVVGTMAYIAGDHSGLQIIDVSNPLNAKLLVSYGTNGDARDVAIVGTTAYVADNYSGLQIIDVSDPATPTLLGSYNTSGNALGVEIVGTIAYVADGAHGLQIIDVSDPSAPTLVSSYDTNSSANNVTIVGTIAYIADGYSGLQIIDISDLSTPTLLGSYDTRSNAYDVTVMGTLAYVTDNFYGLQVIDVTDPAASTLVGSYDTDSYARGVAVVGSLAYVADYYSGLQILDLTSVEVTSVTAINDTTYEINFSDTLTRGAYDIVVGPNLTDLLGNTMDQDADGISGEDPQDVYSSHFAIDNTPPSKPGNLALADDTGSPDDAITSDTSLTLSWSASTDAWGIAGYEFRLNSGDWVPTTELTADLSLSEGEHQFEVRAVDSNGNQSEENVIAIVVDLTQPEAPTGLHLDGTELQWNEATDANGIWKYEYRVDGGDWEETTLQRGPTDLTEGQAGLLEVRAIDRAGNTGPIASVTLIADFGPRVTSNSLNELIAPIDSLTVTFSEPIDPTTFTPEDVKVLQTRPELLGSYSTYDRSCDVTVVGTLAYVADGNGGLQIVDISDPSTPTQVGICFTGPSRSVTVSGTLAYVADYYYGLHIVDIADPTSPKLIGHYNNSTYTLDVALSGVLAYVANGSQGLQILDVSDPTAPILVGDYSTENSVYNVTVSDTLAYIASQSGGLQILDISAPSAPRLVGSYTACYVSKVSVSGMLAYVADYYGGLKILDISNPSSPTLVGSYSIPQATNVTVSGTVAYVTSNTEGLQVIDISDPSTPTLIGSYNNNSNSYAVAISDSTAYLADGTNGLQILDISSVEVTDITQLNETTYQIDLSAPLGSGEYGLFVSPSVADQAGNTMDQDANGVGGENPEDLYLFQFSVDATPPSMPGNLVITDDTGSLGDSITNDTSLTLTWSESSDANGVANYEYCLNGGDWIVTTELTAEVLLTEGEHRFEVRAMDIFGNQSKASELTIVIDSVAPTAPESIRLNGAKLLWDQAFDANGLWKYEYRVDGGSWVDAYSTQTPTGLAEGQNAILEVRAIDRAGNIGPIASATLTPDYGPRVVGSSLNNVIMPTDSFTVTFNEPIDPDSFTVGCVTVAEPQFLGSYDTAGQAEGVTVAGTLAYVADHGKGLQIFDIVDPLNPKRVGGYSSIDFAHDVAVSGTTAYIANWIDGLWAFDVSDPSSPTVLDHYDADGSAMGVTVSDTIAYVANGFGGLQLFSISDPASLSRRGSYDTSDYARDVAVSGTMAYVADTSSGLQIIDITDPWSPKFVGKYNTDGDAYGIAVSGTIAYVADKYEGLKIIDVSDPTNPTLISSYSTGSSAERVTVSGPLAYVASNSSGLYVIDVSDPSEPRLLHRYSTSGIALDVAVSGPLAYVANGSSGLKIMKAFCADVTNITPIDDTTYQIDLSRTLVEDGYELSITPTITDLTGNTMDQDASGVGGENPADTYTFSFTVDEDFNASPNADAGGPYEGGEGDVITLDASGSTDSDGTIVSYEWDLDNDGLYDDALGVTANYNASTAGTFTVAVKVTDDAGATDTSSADVTVQPNFTPGDANEDGRVDGSDVTILAGNWQAGVSDGQTATWSMGDFNHDGKVDGSDVTILASNWQAGVSSTAVAVSSPEPIRTNRFTPPETASFGVATVPRRESLPPRRFITSTPESTDAVLAESSWSETDITAIAKDITSVSVKKSTAASDELFALKLDPYADLQ